MALQCIKYEWLKSSEKTGRNQFVDHCVSISVNNSAECPLRLQRAFFEICCAVLKGAVKVETAANAVKRVAEQVQDVPTVLADVLSIMDLQTSCSEDKIARENFIALVIALLGVVGECLLKERLEQDTLDAVGLVASKLQFQQKYVKTKTRLYYKQQKFNLLREESEGYAKLIVELNQEMASSVTPQAVIEHVKALIGCFDLDPNRVIDIMLESFEQRLHLQEFYLPLLKLYGTDSVTLCHILGFRFFTYSPEECDTPSSLFHLAAVLLKNGFITLDCLSPHLCPSEADMVRYQQKEVQNAKAYSKKLLTINLSSDKGTNDKDRDDMHKPDMKTNNQRLGLCEALISIGAWDCAKKILEGLPDGFAISHEPIVRSLCRLTHCVIEPLYSKHTGLSSAILKRRAVPERVPRVKCASSFVELSRLAFPILLQLGPHVGADPTLVIKLIRLGRIFMVKVNKLYGRDKVLTVADESVHYGLLSVLGHALLPSLSFMPGNCCLAEELWALLKLLPYEIRYRMYGQWKNEAYFSHPKLIRIRADSIERAKYIMKRISKETVKPCGRQFGKLGHSNPGILFDLVLSQIQRYDNFIGPVVDALKYLTAMSYDILAYCLIEAVANPEKERMKTDDTNISLWLQSLAQFAGSICRKYPVELTGIMQYVANQLKAGKSLDMLLLREVVQKMTGIEITEEMTDDQLHALSGGELLRQEGGNFTQVRNMKKSSTRLKDTLLERDLALSLCLLMAQQRSAVVFCEDGSRHLKLVGKLYDQCQDTLVQFGSFLSTQLSTEEFVKRLPPINELIASYHVPQDAAFFLSRVLYSHSIQVRHEKLLKSDRQSGCAVSSELRYVEAAGEVQKTVLETLKPLFPDRFWVDFTPSFYWTFWSLSIYDLRVPSAVYQKQRELLLAQIQQIEDNKELPQSKKKKERERCQLMVERLKDEERKQTDHIRLVMARLMREKDSWFPSGMTKSEMMTNFMQMCLFPRCLFTASDALYCACFIHILHSVQTPNFSTLICYDLIFCDITYTISSCTENEAHRYSRFLASALETVMGWHSSLDNYTTNCAKYPGFVTVFRKGMGCTNKLEHLDYENFRHVCHKWHFRLAKSIILCLESGNFIQIRNALIFLTKVLNYFPRISQIGNAIIRRVEKLKLEEKDKRKDIYALSVRYLGLLTMKESQWVPVAEFHIKPPKVMNPVISTSLSTAKDGTKPCDVKPEEGRLKEKGDALEVECVNDKQGNGEKQEKGEAGKESGGVDGVTNHTGPKSAQSKNTDGVEDRKCKEVIDPGMRQLDEFGQPVKDDKVSKEDKPKKGERKDRDRGKERDRGKRTHVVHDDDDDVVLVSPPASRHSHDLPTPVSDDRETKRRKLDSPGSGSQESLLNVSGRSKSKSTMSGDKDDGERDRERKRRDHLSETGDGGEKKKRRSDEHHEQRHSRSKQNGEQVERGARIRDNRDHANSKDKARHETAVTEDSTQHPSILLDYSPPASKIKERKSSSRKLKK